MATAGPGESGEAPDFDNIGHGAVDHLLVTSASGITNLLGGGNESEGGYFVRFYFLPSGAGDAGEANRELAKNVTFSQGTGMITITSSNDEYAVTLNATPHGEYIKIEVEASRGFVPNPWEPGQTDFELELVVDVGLDGVEASWADAGQAAMPAWLGPTGAVGLLPLDFLVDCKATRTALHARWTGGLLGAGSRGAVALAAAGSAEHFSHALAAVQGGEAGSLPGPRPSGGGLWLAPTSLPQDFEALHRALAKARARGLRLGAAPAALQVQPFELQVEISTQLACPEPGSLLFEAALASRSFEALGVGTLAAPLGRDSEEALVMLDAATAGMFPSLATTESIDGFTELRQLQIGAELLSFDHLEVSGEAWNLTLNQRGLLGTSPTAAAVGSEVQLLLFHDRRPLLKPDSPAWQEAILEWAKDAGPGTTLLGTGRMCTGALGRRGWVQRKLLLDAARAAGSLRLAGQLGESFAYYTGTPLKQSPPRCFAGTSRLALEAELAAASPLHLEGYEWLNAYEFGAFQMAQDRPTGSSRATSSDEVEWLMAKLLAFGGSAELQGQPEVLEASQALASAGLWAEAARRNWLPKSLQKVLAARCHSGSGCSPDGFYRMAGVFGDNNESLEAVRFWPMGRKVSFVPADGSPTTILRNPWQLQPLRFELQVLPTFDFQQRQPLLPAQLSLFGTSYNSSQLAVTGGNFSFRLEALVDLTDRLIKATWALPSGLLDFSQAAAGYSGVLMNVTGNGLGGLLLLELSAGEGRTPLRFAVENNFIGRREVFLTSHEEAEEEFAAELQLLGRQPLLQDGDLWISRVSVGLLGAAAQAAVLVENAVAVRNVLSPLASPTLFVKDKTTGEVLSSMTVSGCMPTRQYLVYEGGGTAQLLDEQRKPQAELTVSGALMQAPGDFLVGVEADSQATCGAGGAPPWLRAVWRSLGEEAIFGAGTTDPTDATQPSTSSHFEFTSKGADMPESLLVGVQFKVEGLDFIQLVADSAFLEQFKQVVKGALIAATARADRRAEDLVLQLSPGSVVVQARMAAVARGGESVAAAMTILADGMRHEASALQRDLIVRLAGIQGLSSVAYSAISVGPISVSLLAVEATPQPAHTVQDFIPLWAIVALSILTCFTMIVGLIAVYMQRRWAEERRKRSLGGSEGSDPVYMTRRVRSRVPGSTSPQTASESPEAPKKRSTSRLLMSKRAAGAMRKVRFSDAEMPEVQEYDPRELQLAAAESSQRNQKLEAKVAELEAALKNVQGTLCVAEDRLAEVSKERDQLSLSVSGAQSSTLLQQSHFARSSSGTRRSLGILGDCEESMGETDVERGEVVHKLEDLEAGSWDGFVRHQEVLDAESVRSDPRSEFSLWATETGSHQGGTSESAGLDQPDDDLQITRV